MGTRIVIVTNPTSGRGRGAKLVPQVTGFLRSMGVDHSLHICAGPADPERLARQAVEDGAEIVVALGGDGQVGLCANALIGTDTALAVIPAGTGNDFARHLGLDRKDPLAAARLLTSPRTRQIDAVKVTTPERERHFVNVGGTGFDSEVNEHANHVRFLKGTPKYIFSTFVTLARFTPGRFDLTVDGEHRQISGMMIAIGNGQSYGGGMRITPHAKSDDGMLEVCVIGEVSKLEFMRTFPKVFKGKHVSHPKVTMLRGEEISIAAERPFEVYGDGEQIGPLPATFRVVPRALWVVAPAR
jgi:diacylglycerol kinase (ATP)